MPEKIYCYVDETGLDTKGSLFIVCVIIVPASERDTLSTLCEEAERFSEKGKRKWTTTVLKRRRKYMQEIDRWPMSESCCYYGLYQGSRKYEDLTIKTLIAAIKEHALKHDYTKATIHIDGLQPEQVKSFSIELRQNGIRIKKVRGVNDESFPEIRLADAMCGRTRAA
jgi:hypothetical protein